MEDSPTIVIENQGKRKGDSDLECHVAHKRKRDEMEEIDESDKYLQSFKVHCNGMKLFECNDCNEVIYYLGFNLNYLLYVFIFLLTDFS